MEKIILIYYNRSFYPESARTVSRETGSSREEESWAPHENRGDPRCTGIGLVPYRFYPLISGSGGTGALKRFVPTGSITEECSRANPGGWGLSTESLLDWKRPPCIATTVSSPKGQGRIEFRRGTTADPDPVEYLLRLTILIYWHRKFLYEYI